MSDELIRLTATEAVARLRRGDITPLDLIDAAEQRIAQVDGPVNALPTLCLDRARDHARALMAGKRREAEAEPGWLAGLPVAIKDLTDVAGVRTTYGSPIFARHVPTKSHPLVERIERRGGIVIAKSNTPEFGAGGNTYNEVFGRTRNPWNTSLTCGGSTGGGAVALATGTAWLAHGSDHGGSLRGPATLPGASVVNVTNDIHLHSDPMGIMVFFGYDFSTSERESMRALTIATAAALLLSGCAVEKNWVATGGSRSDGVVRLSFEVGEFEIPQLNEQQAVNLATQRCRTWGYRGAEAFGGVTRQCNQGSGRSCGQWIVTKEYQCTGTGSPTSR